MSKNVLFHSEYCFFSKDVMSLLTKKNLLPVFTLICVDSYRNQLPAFVRSVPTIFTLDRRVLEGQAALDFVDLMHQSRRMPHFQATAMQPLAHAHGHGLAQPQPHAQPHVLTQAQPSSQPFKDNDAPMECSSASPWSESYSFLEPSDNLMENGSFSGVTDDTRIQCVPENSDRKNASAGSMQAQQATPLSNYMACRDSDTEILRTQQLAGQGPGGNCMRR